MEGLHGNRGGYRQIRNRGGGKALERRAVPRRSYAAIAAMLEPSLAGGALRGVVLLLALALALLLRGVGLRILGKGHGHGGGEEGEAEHQRHQFLHCGNFSPGYLDDLKSSLGYDS